MAFIKRADNQDGVCNFDNMGFFSGPTATTPIPSGTGGITVDPITRVFRDNSGSSTTFVVDFTDTTPATLVVERFVQNDGITINIENANIIFTAAPTSLTNDLATLGIVAGASPVWNLQFCSIGTTSGLTSGFGTFPENYVDIGTGDGRGIRPAGSISNNTFYATNGANGLWFINLAGSDSSLTIAGNTYNQTALHTNVNASFIQNSSFDGAVRALGGNNVHTAYTMRFPFIPGVWTAGVGNRFDGTGYATTAATGTGNIVHFATNYTGATSKDYYSINQLFQHADITFSGNTTDETFTVRDGYTWNPKFRNVSTNALIRDVHLIGIPSNVLVPLSTLNTATEWLPAADEALVAEDGYYIHLTQQTTSSTTRRQSQQATKIIDYDASVTTGVINDKLTPIASAIHPVRAKGYSHLIDVVLDTQVDRVGPNDGSAGTPWEYTEEHTTQAGLDAELNGTSLAEALALRGLSTLDNFYPAIKAHWVDGSLNQSLAISQVGAAITFNRQTSITQDDVLPTEILDTEIQIRSSTTGFTTTTVNEMVFTDSNSRYAGHSLAPLTLNTGQNAITIDEIARSDALLTLDGFEFFMRAIDDNSFAGIHATSDTTIILPEATEADQELDLELAWGGLTIDDSTVGIRATGGPGSHNYVLTNVPAGLFEGANVLFASSVTFEGLRGSETAGTARELTRISIYPANAADEVAENANPVATGFQADTVVFNTAQAGVNTNERYRYIYTRPGFDHLTGAFILSGNTVITLNPSPTPSANLTGIAATGSSGEISVAYVNREINANDIATTLIKNNEYRIETILDPDWSGAGGLGFETVENRFFAIDDFTAAELAFLGTVSNVVSAHMSIDISGARGSGEGEPVLSPVATNNLFEFAKTNENYGDAIIRMGLSNEEQLINHSGTTQTSLVDHRYSLNTGQIGNQQNVTNVFQQEYNTIDGYDGVFIGPELITPIVGVTAGIDLTVESVLIATAASGISFGDFQASQATLEAAILSAITDSEGVAVELTDDATNRDIIINAVRRSGAV